MRYYVHLNLIGSPTCTNSLEILGKFHALLSCQNDLCKTLGLHVLNIFANIYQNRSANHRHRTL